MKNGRKRPHYSVSINSNIEQKPHFTYLECGFLYVLVFDQKKPRNEKNHVSRETSKEYLIN
jgi:hypothetical protein